MDLSDLQKELLVLESLRNKVHDKERELKEQFIKIEKETFEGKTYWEYVNSLKINEIKEDVCIEINGYRISAKYQLKGLELSASGSVWENGCVNVSAEYPTKSIAKVPKKYAKEEKHLLDVCESYRIINPVSKLKDKYKIYY